MHASVHVKHVRFALRRAYTNVERGVLRILRVEENQADAEDTAKRAEAAEVVLRRVRGHHDVRLAAEEAVRAGLAERGNPTLE